jgi:hypothetical protein
MLTSGATGKDTKTIRAHHHVAGPQTAVGKQFRNWIRDLAWGLRLQWHLDRSRLDLNGFWTRASGRLLHGLTRRTLGRPVGRS